MTERTLGNLIRTLRRRRGQTLKELSQQVGIPLSTLSKIENDKLSLTYDKLHSFTQRLGMSIVDFLSQDELPVASDATLAAPVTARRSVVNDENSLHVPTPNYDYEYLCVDLSRKRMVPILTTVRARSIDEFGGLIRHIGEEFIYVINGVVELRTEFYEPLVMTAGQGVYIDSTMGHAYLSGDGQPAFLLAICSAPDPHLQKALVDKATESRKAKPGAEVPASAPTSRATKRVRRSA